MPNGEGKMKPQTLAPQQRKKLQQKIMAAFKTEMKDLRKPFQKILADDLVTAFENRISVIHAFQQKTSQKRG
jgi:phage-related protein